MKRGLILLGWRILTWFGTSGRIVKDNVSVNRDVLKQHNLWPQGGYIERQSELGALKFGKTYTMAYGGCGLIALYNTLVALGKQPTYEVFLELSEALQRKGAAWGGKYGIHPVFIRRWFKFHGYRVERIAVTEKTFDEREADYNVFVVTILNGLGLKGWVHTVCITRNEEGYVVHNGPYHKPFPTLKEAIYNSSRQGATAIYAMGVGDVSVKE